ncbi:MAG: L-glutamate gamma-semialdehyde dehydrogenase [Spirochaetes bacterium]|nr:MAG: L-glutamate gamma-semialdehyde dehydrogenase [Spirochaetota bacterium]
MNDRLQERILATARGLFERMEGEKPSLFNTSSLIGRLLGRTMENDHFKTALFRFIDVFPSLTTGKQVSRHVREYFGADKSLPRLISLGARIAGSLGTPGGVVMGKAISYMINTIGRQFILGATVKEALKNAGLLRKKGFAVVLDALGEATLSAEETRRYVELNLELLKGFREASTAWAPLEGKGLDPARDWGASPKINVSIKPSALYCLASPIDFEGSVEAILAQLRRLLAAVIESNGFLCIDMESYRFKDITLEVYRRIKRENPEYPHIGIVLQAYLHDTDRDVDALLAWARDRRIQIAVRLVKGAYWDYERAMALQNGWSMPVRTRKAETDAAYERLARRILENHDICHFSCATHNIRTIAAVLETARELKVPDNRYEFQALYGMAEPVRQAVLADSGRVRLYCPFGDIVPGMQYLVRRLLENTSNESFLRLSFAGGTPSPTLLENPAHAVRRAREEYPEADRTKQSGGENPFTNEPGADFTRAAQREAFPMALAAIRAKVPVIRPLYIGGKRVVTRDRIRSVNPANPAEVIGFVCQAGTQEAAAAIAAAKKAFMRWRDTPPRARAEFLFKAASAAKRRIFELAAWQVLEAGKQWDQAHADVAEAIDYFEYYAREMIRIGSPAVLGNLPAEQNLYFYEPRGVAAVIAPWNFPLAISAGMASAAIVTGNTVVYKPSGLTGIIGGGLVDIFREAGLPDGVFNFIPGRSEVIGDYLVDHPDISLIAFTGSMETGLRITGRAARVNPGQPDIKKTITELGGKNAIIIDDDADLDEAVPHVLASAFGYQGQKCSACSRVIVLNAIHDRFVNRLVEAARAYRVGPAEDPSTNMGPVADENAVRKIMRYIETGRHEGRVLYESRIPDDGGYYVPLVIIDRILPQHSVAREEIFGPVLVIMRAKDFGQAIEWANATPFALTGGVFSRSPANIDRARKEFRVGNLYINRGITGAMVGRQPFGGMRMSGTGTRAGGPDYLLHFMVPRTVTENTMRRGFVPVDE